MKIAVRAVAATAIVSLALLTCQPVSATEIAGKKPKPKPQKVALMTVTLTQQMLYGLNMPMGSAAPPASEAQARLAAKCNSRSGREITIVSDRQVIATGSSTVVTAPSATLHDQTRDKYLQMDFYTGSCVTGAAFANLPKKSFYEVRIGGAYAGTWSYSTVQSQGFVIPLNVSGVLSCEVDLTDGTNTCG